MQINPFRAFSAFGAVAGKYLEKPQQYQELFTFLPDLGGLVEAIRKKEKEPNHNDLLHEIFAEQLHPHIKQYPAVAENVAAFGQASTLSITTGHQLVLAGGPAYLYYKISTVICLSRQLSHLTGVKVVPVFWLASEDHDIEEIKEGNIKGKAYKWDGQWDGYSGVLPTDLLQEWKTLLLQELSAGGAPQSLRDRIEKAYRPGITLAQATTDFIMDVFGNYGLLVLNPDDSRLKSLFEQVMTEEVSEKKAYQAMQPLIQKWGEIWQINKLEPQVKPREINLFFLHQKRRHRIVPDEKGVFTAGNQVWSNTEQLLAQIKLEPEKFSPNVVLRPLYQEIILPNIAYVGGPGEIHYWLELKPVFDAYGITFPVLLPRLSVMALSEKANQKWIGLGLDWDDFGGSLENIQKKQLRQLNEISLNWDAAKQELEGIYENLKTGVHKIEPTLQPAVLAELNKSLQGIEQLKGRVNKALKQKNETVLRQSEKIYSELFPGGIPQERVETGLGLEWQIGEGFVKLLAEREITPGDPGTYLLTY